MAKLNSVGPVALGGILRADDLRRRVEQLENSFAGRHRRLQDVVFVAQILNGPPEPLRVLDEHGQHADGDPAREHAESAPPDHQRNRQGGKQFDGGIVERIGEDGVFEGDHVQAVDGLEVVVGAALAVEELHHAHARDVFLGEAVDAGDGGADAAEALAHVVAEDAGDDQDERQHGEGDQRQPPVDAEHDGGHDDQVEEVVHDGQHAGGKHIVDGVHVGGEPGDQAAHGVSVEEADVHALHVAEDVAAQVEHDLLPRPLHQVSLNELKEI